MVSAVLFVRILRKKIISINNNTISSKHEIVSKENINVQTKNVVIK